MIVILLGPPGAGKGAQAKKMEQRYGLQQVSTGEMLRAEVAAGTALGSHVKALMDDGIQVPDDIMVDMLGGRLAADEADGIILDGFPRSLPQAEALDRMLEGRGRAVDAVVELQIGDDLAVERIAGRFSCGACGAGYHRVFNPPQDPNRCDVCGATADRFVYRSDDTEVVVRQRMENYRQWTAPVLPYYQARGLLHGIDGAQSIEAVFQEVAAVIDPLHGPSAA